jgi:LCP family protein required for cell wall assembly
MNFFAKLKRKLYKNLFLIKLAGGIVGLGLILVLGIKTFLPVLTKVPKLVADPTANLKSEDGRINILLLGAGGGNHDGPDLTDTMILASLPATGSGNIYLISLPRDIYLDSLNDKINAAYQQGEEKKPGSGLVLAKAVVGQITGLPVHYAVKIDFSVFSTIIDLLGGIDVEVENSFTDKMYPIAGRENDLCGGQDPQYLCRYEEISFTKGLNHMDGATALKFARSRHSEDLVEGTDFARSRRQQKIIAAIKQKLLTLPGLLDFNKDWQIYQTIKSRVVTDIPEDEARGFFYLALRLKDSPLININLDEKLLINPPMDPVRGWYLVPRNGSFALIHEFLQQQLSH